MVVWIRKTAWAVLALALFIVALEVLKHGAGVLGPALTAGLHVDDVFGALGFGWLLAYASLSGSPVAATAITFYSEAVLDAYEAFAMITGSRFGAAFVVLLLGFVYHVRRKPSPVGHEGGTSLEMGVLSLLVTFAIYVPALVVGWFLLGTRLFEGLEIRVPALLDLVDAATGPFVRTADALLPSPVVFLLGFVVLVLAMRLFDKALPDLKGLRARTAVQRVYRPVVTFTLGFLVTLVTLSVSVSIGLLVPLAAKGYARRENVVPYIMGANVSTFVDTLLAAVLVGGRQGAIPPTAVVLAEIVSVAAVSLAVILVGYRTFEHALFAATRTVLRTRATLAAFVIVILVIPVVLLFL